MENNIEPLLVSYLLEKGEVTLPSSLMKQEARAGVGTNAGHTVSLPSSLMKQEAVIEIEKALRSGSPIRLKQTFENFSNNIDKFLKSDDLEKLVEFLKEFEAYNQSYIIEDITEDDKKIINYLVSLEKVDWKFVVETLGPIYFLLKIWQEIEKSSKSLPKTIIICVAIYSYLVLYELILHQVDRRLYSNMKSINVKPDKYKKFLDIRRKEFHDHATAGMINEILSDILNLPRENKSIFGGISETKIFRNKIAHANIFYDEDREEIIIAGKSYKVNDFLKLLSRLYIFSIRWFEKALKVDIYDSDALKNRILKYIKKSFDDLSKFFSKISRFGLKREFASLIISWKKEAGVED